MTDDLMTRYVLPSCLAATLLTLHLDYAQAQERPWLGVCFSGWHPADLRVDTVQGPASDAGILGGDVIVSLNGRSIADPKDLFCSLVTKRLGEAVRVIVLRDRQTLSFSATLTHWPHGPAPPLNCENIAGQASEPSPLSALPSAQHSRAEPLRIAIVDFSGIDGVVGTVTRAVVDDLLGTGTFTRIDPAAYAGEQASIGLVPRVAAWRELGAQALVVGRIERTPNDRFRAEFQLFDVAAGHFVLGESLSVAENQLVRLGHVIAEKLYQRLTGQKRTFE